MPPFPLRGPREDDIGGRPKIDKLLPGKAPGKDTGPFSEPGGRSGGIETGNLRGIAVRTLWDHSRGPKSDFLGQNKNQISRVTGRKLLLINN